MPVEAPVTAPTLASPSRARMHFAHAGRLGCSVTGRVLTPDRARPDPWDDANGHTFGLEWISQSAPHDRGREGHGVVLPCTLVLRRGPVGVAFVACVLVASRAFSQPIPAGRAPFWEERFERADLAALGWADPSKHGASALSRVYSIVHEGGLSFLHARHDATTRPSPPAMHLGTPFPGGTAPLDKVHRLTWLIYHTNRKN